MIQADAPADICRKNGWVVGDVLEGTGDWGNGKSATDRIEITAIGERSILAKAIWPQSLPESLWALSHRDWKKVDANRLARVLDIVRAEAADLRARAKRASASSAHHLREQAAAIERALAKAEAVR